MHCPASPLALTLLLAAGTSPAALLDDGPPSSEVPAAVLERVVVVGASASGGFGLQNELKARGVQLDDFLVAALKGVDGPLPNESDLWFFQKPFESGPRQIEAALGARPTLVFALDYLFWFAYGHMANEGVRERCFERGLELLEELECPMLVGDLPDMHAALEAKVLFGGPMIQPEQVPETATLARLNERLREWAAERPRVVLVPMSEWTARLRADEPLEVRGNTWPPERAQGLLQDDLLHPSVEGVAALTVLALDALDRAGLGPQAEAVEWRASELVARIREQTAAEREKTLQKEREREQRRTERRAKREEPEDGGGEQASRLHRRAPAHAGRAA